MDKYQFHATDAYRFTAPELLYISEHKPDPESCTVWSLGVLIREMVVFRFPFDHSEVFYKIEALDKTDWNR